MNKSNFLRRAIEAAWAKALDAVDPESAVLRNVKLFENNLLIGDQKFSLKRETKIFSIALGKAAHPMARGLSRVLGERLNGGVLSCPVFENDLEMIWQVFRGGHPLPNEDSLKAAQAAFELLAKADEPENLIIFLISGGGSAMMELPRENSLALDDLQAANSVLVNCGAMIAEINALRRRISKIKGGGLSQAIKNAAKISLIISDTNPDEVFNVASGPTVPPPENDFSETHIKQIIKQYRLDEKLPKKILALLEKNSIEDFSPQSDKSSQKYFVLLDNRQAVEAAAEALREKDFIVEVADDLIEAEIGIGCTELVERLLKLRETIEREKPVAIVSGGEFICPARGAGRGGRNSEAALRCAILLDEIKRRKKFSLTNFCALFAGTDGIDGNSPAAGAFTDATTIERARKLNLNPALFLADSDSYTFFSALGDALVTGATGTNVRDIRILATF